MSQEEKEYSLFVPEDINTRKDLGFGLDKEGTVKGTLLAGVGGALLGSSYFFTHSDVLTVLFVLVWISFSYMGYARSLFGGKRSFFKQLGLIRKYQRGQKEYRYRHRKEWTKGQ